MNFATALLDAREMGEADRLTVAAGSSVSALMENAGRGVAEEIVRRWPQRRVTVLCGLGNNGGDGFVAACHLAAAGWNVRVALLGPQMNLKDAARYHAEKWRGSIEALTPTSIDSAELVVDAIFGAGLSRPSQVPPRIRWRQPARSLFPSWRWISRAACREIPAKTWAP